MGVDDSSFRGFTYAVKERYLFEVWRIRLFIVLLWIQTLFDFIILLLSHGILRIAQEVDGFTR